jgi:hypothetical protein
MQAFKTYTILLLSLLFFSCQKQGSFNSLLRFKNIDLIFDEDIELVINDDQQNSVIGKKDNKTIIKVQQYKISDQNEAKRFVNNYVENELLLYKTGAVPYPGQMSHDIICNPKFLPVFERKLEFEFLKFIADEKYFPVTCQGEKEKFRGVQVFLWLKHKSLLKLEMFKRDDGLENELIKFLVKNKGNYILINLRE